MLRKILFALWLALLPVQLRAECVLAKLADLPVTMLGLRPTIPVKIDGNDARLLVDSGGFFSLLSPGAAAQFNLRLRDLPRGMDVRGINGSVKASLTTAKSLMLAGQTLPNVDFIVGGTSETGIAGTLGANVLGANDIEYDLPDGMIRLFRPKGCSNTNFAYWAGKKPYSVLQLESGGPTHWIVASVVLNGRKMKALFDTGAAGSYLTLQAAARLGVKPGDPGVTPAGEMGGLGNKRITTWIAPFDSLQIGDGETIQKIRLRIGGGELADNGIDMLIGFDFFLSHRAYIANSAGKMFLSYETGPVFNLSLAGKPWSTAPDPGKANPGALAPATGDEPKDADGFSRRAQVAAARRDFAAAIADLTRAIALAPAEPRYLYLRALAHAGNSQADLAMADLDTGLKLRPDDIDMLLLRARLHLKAKDVPAVITDLDAANHVAPPSASQRLEIGVLYGALAEFHQEVTVLDRAIAQFDQWLKYHPDDLAVPEVLNSRCFARAEQGRDLDKAIADCNRSLRMRPNDAATLDSRGLVQFRRGAFSQAIADYDAALAIRPKAAPSLYARGLAKNQLGPAHAGDGDMAAAMAIDPNIAKSMAAIGVTGSAPAAN